MSLTTTLAVKRRTTLRVQCERQLPVALQTANNHIHTRIRLSTPVHTNSTAGVEQSFNLVALKANGLTHANQAD